VVVPHSGLSGTTTHLPIDIRRLSWTKRLTADYALDYSSLASFFAGDPADPDEWRRAIARAQHHPRDRESVAAILEAQQRRRGAPPEARAAVACLRNRETVAVLTGQQAGLFGGPLFTLLKAITAVRLAEKVRTEFQVPAVAVFWVDAEDHDWNEVKGCGILDSDLEFREISMGSPPGSGQVPVAHVSLDESVTRALSDLELALPRTEFTSQLLADLRKTYSVGTGTADAFARWLETVLGHRGLIVFDGADPDAKPLAAGIFAHELQNPGEASRLAADAGEKLKTLGYHAQVTTQAGAVALFHLATTRQPIRQREEGFVIGERPESRNSLLERVWRTPGEFSPNVLLRPIVQDTLFPTACLVSGPNELAYLAQLGGVYRAYGVPMPLMYLRLMATLVDSNSSRFLTRYHLSLESLRPQDEASLNQLLASQLPSSIDATLQEVSALLENHIGVLAKALPQVDPTLEAAARASLGRMQDELKKLQNKIIQAAKKKDDTLRRQFRHAQAQAFPSGRLQEREVGFVTFLNTHGPSLVDRLADELPLTMGTHWVVKL
jgi:bacillithiol biosynthesis cysteine-adding enzyme BshC